MIEIGSSGRSNAKQRDGNNWYSYVQHDPVNLRDFLGVETTVIVIHANTWWEGIVGASHVAIHFSNPGIDKYGDAYGETLYDPSGGYAIGNRNHPTSGLFSEEDANLNNYIIDVENRDNGETCTIYKFATTPEQESAMVEKAMILGNGWGFSCADNVSNVLQEIGAKQVFTPGALEAQLPELQKKTNNSKSCRND